MDRTEDWGCSSEVGTMKSKRQGTHPVPYMHSGNLFSCAAHWDQSGHHTPEDGSVLCQPPSWLSFRFSHWLLIQNDLRLWVSCIGKMLRIVQPEVLCTQKSYVCSLLLLPLFLTWCICCWYYGENRFYNLVDMIFLSQVPTCLLCELSQRTWVTTVCCGHQQKVVMVESLLQSLLWSLA